MTDLTVAAAPQADVTDAMIQKAIERRDKMVEYYTQVAGRTWSTGALTPDERNILVHYCRSLGLHYEQGHVEILGGKLYFTHKAYLHKAMKDPRFVGFDPSCGPVAEGTDEWNFWCNRPGERLWRCTVRFRNLNGDEVTYTDYGRAHPDTIQMSTIKQFPAEMAKKRAESRALRAGLAMDLVSADELYAETVVDANARVVQPQVAAPTAPPAESQSLDAPSDLAVETVDYGAVQEASQEPDPVASPDGGPKLWTNKRRRPDAAKVGDRWQKGAEGPVYVLGEEGIWEVAEEDPTEEPATPEEASSEDDQAPSSSSEPDPLDTAFDPTKHNVRLDVDEDTVVFIGQGEPPSDAPADSYWWPAENELRRMNDQGEFVVLKHTEELKQKVVPAIVSRAQAHDYSRQGVLDLIEQTLGYGVEKMLELSCHNLCRVLRAFP